MKVEFKSPDEAKILLDEITERYRLAHTRPNLHATDAIYCLRKAYWDKIDQLPPTPRELLYFIQGLGLQQAMLGEKEEPLGCVETPEFSLFYSPDRIINDQLVELKTGRTGRKKLEEGLIPEGWIKQIMFYCWAMGKKQALLVDFTIISPEIIPIVLTFTSEELEENAQWVMERAKDLHQCLTDKVIPPKEEGWQCRNCRYGLRCRVENDK